MKKLLVLLLIVTLGFTLQAEHSIGKKIDKKLVDAKGKRHKSDLANKKYVIFYYSASWCPPCQKFTPELVDFYNKNKNDNFEIVLVSSDSDQNSMRGYMKSKKMPFPALKFSEARNKEVRQFAGRGIPFLAMIDESGKAVVQENAFSALPKIEKMLK